MRFLSSFIISLLLLACHHSASKKEDLKDTAKTVTQMPETPAAPDTIFTAFGTEPFWAAYVIKNNKLVFHPADGDKVELPFVAATTPDTSTVRYSSVTNNASIELTISNTLCSDGMSEIAHPFSVEIVVNKTKYSGCGRKD